MNKKLNNATSVFWFYFAVIRFYKPSVFGLFFTGVLSRIINLIAFVSIIKVFLVVINPDSFVPKIINKLGDYFGEGSWTISQDDVVLVLLVVLQMIMILNYVVNRVHLLCFIGIKKKIGNRFSNLPISDDMAKRRNFAMETLPKGCEQFIKIFEIIFFFLVVLSVIFYVNYIVGCAVILLIPLFVLFMVISSRKDVLLVGEHKSSKVGMGLKSFNEYLGVVHSSSRLVSHRRKRQALSQFIAGTIVVCIISIFFLFDQDEGFVSLWAIALVFGIRYIVNYAKELSATVAKLLSGRVLIKPVLGMRFKEISSFLLENDSSSRGSV